ncbi:hypothetical protein PybrP1_006728 [[Pythium] brassicae (nom. inval.)]|nr:hypothetical protein PybrP1_006728 [[Pythium] brassicae (nom. inval.)]
MTPTATPCWRRRKLPSTCRPLTADLEGTRSAIVRVDTATTVHTAVWITSMSYSNKHITNDMAGYSACCTASAELITPTTHRSTSSGTARYHPTAARRQHTQEHATRCVLPPSQAPHRPDRRA